MDAGTGPPLHSVRSVQGRVSQSISGERVLGALHAAADLRQARALSNDDVRSALAVAYALRELAVEQLSWSTTRRQLSSLDVPISAAVMEALSSRSGATARQVSRGLELLLASQVILRIPGRADVRFAPSCLVDIVHSRSSSELKAIRESLRARRAAIMPALAVVHHLNDLTPDSSGWLVSPLEQIAARTFFRRSTVARAAIDLEAIAAIERPHRPGLRSHYRLLPLGRPTPSAAGAHTAPEPHVGLPDPSSRAEAQIDVPIVTEESRESRPGDRPVDGSRPTEANIPAEVAASSWPAVEIAGVVFPIPPGVSLAPELDDDGRLWYRLGSAKIGPISL